MIVYVPLPLNETGVCFQHGNLKVLCLTSGQCLSSSPLTKTTIQSKKELRKLNRTLMYYRNNYCDFCLNSFK